MFTGNEIPICKRDLHLQVHCRAILNSQDVDTTQVSLHGLTAKANVVFRYPVLLEICSRPLCVFWPQPQHAQVLGARAPTHSTAATRAPAVTPRESLTHWATANSYATLLLWKTYISTCFNNKSNNNHHKSETDVHFYKYRQGVPILAQQGWLGGSPQCQNSGSIPCQDTGLRVIACVV